jgi:hypothetical protein
MSGPEIRYSNIGKEITVRMNADSLPDRDAINLLVELMRRYSPVERNQAYDDACNAVIAEANKYWDGRKA